MFLSTQGLHDARRSLGKRYSVKEMREIVAAAVEAGVVVPYRALPPSITVACPGCGTVAQFQNPDATKG